MKKIRNILVSFTMTVALLMSSSVFAGEETDAQVRAAGEGTLAKIEEAASLQTQGADKTEVEAALKEARQLQKEFRFEGTELLRQKFGGKLRIARKQVSEGDPAAASTLQEMVDMFKEMMTLYNAAHR